MEDAQCTPLLAMEDPAGGEGAATSEPKVAESGKDKEKEMEIKEDVDFLINTLTGGQMQVTLPRRDNIADLKNAVSKHWEMPPDSQSFTDGNEPFGTKDSDVFSKLLGSRSGTISLTLVLTTTALAARLDNPSFGTRVAALTELAQLGGRGTAHAETVCGILQNDEEHRVRRAAAAALQKIASADNETILDVLIAQFGKEENAAVQQSIAEGMSKFASEHADRIFGCVLAKLESKDVSRRRAGLIALPLIFGSGNRRAALMACSQLDDTNQSFRFQALQALSQLSAPGDEEVIEAVMKRSEDPCSFVKCHALKVLPGLLKPGSERACEVRAWQMIDEVQQQNEAQQQRMALQRDLTEKAPPPQDVASESQTARPKEAGPEKPGCLQLRALLQMVFPDFMFS